MNLAIVLPIVLVVYVIVITGLSYRLGCTKTEDPKKAAIIGFLLSFLPPFALIYLVILVLKSDVTTV